MFEKVNTTSRRTKDEYFIYCETRPIYLEEQVPITVSRQGYSPNVVFMKGYRKAEDYYFVKNVTNRKVINDRYIRINNYDKKNKNSMKQHRKKK